MLPEEVFPYPSFREGQKELADAVYQACSKGQRFVAEAMSGFGKTSAVLAGSIAAAHDDGLDIVYVCRTKRQVLRVLEELGRIAQRQPIKATSLYTKYDYCLLRQEGFRVSPETFKWYCSFQTSNNLCSYFLNTSFNVEKLTRMVEEHTSKPGTISDLLAAGRELHVCPYELARLSLASSKVIVTTYHYLLDKASRSVLFRGDEPLDKVVAVIDEAHNIRDFLSGNSTVTMSFSEMEQCITDSRRLYLPRIASMVSEICDKAKTFCSMTDHWQVAKDAFASAISSGHTKDWLADLVFELSTNAGVAWYSVATSRNMPPSIIKFGAFMSTILASIDNEDVVLVKSEDSLSLADSNAPKKFMEATSGFKGLVLLSATIDPADLFLRSIGLDKTTTVLHTAKTSYRFKIKTVIDSGVTTRFSMRTHEMYARIATRIASIGASGCGGIGVFLPSYSVLDAIRKPLLDGIEDSADGAPPRTVVVEDSGLTSDESDRIMGLFKSTPKAVLLAVQGGRFSEGEDFPGDMMDVSVVVGLSLPPPSPTMFAEYQRMEARGFDKHEAYMTLSLLPALRKAFQCAGRHVRDPGKVGMVFFMDSRFAASNVVDLMPAWLKEDLAKGDFGAASILTIATDFFSSAKVR